MLWEMRSLAAISSLLLLGAVPSPTDPYAIYDRARSVLASERYPDRFQFRVTIGVLEAGVAKAEHFHAESVGGDVRSLGVSDEEHDAPHYVRGVNLRLVMRLAWNEHSGGPSNTWSAAGNRKEALPDFLGVPLLSPAYMFGLTTRTADMRSDLGYVNSSLPSIATVVSTNRAYDISLAGEESIDGQSAYHLRLRPLRSPLVYRLRDLWVDETTFDVARANLQGNFVNAPMSNVPWTVTFATVDGLTYIQSESTAASLYFRRDRTFDGAMVTFDQISDANNGLPALPNVLEQNVLREP
jgi:hypothetical protein